MRELDEGEWEEATAANLKEWEAAASTGDATEKTQFAPSSTIVEGAFPKRYFSSHIRITNNSGVAMGLRIDSDPDAVRVSEVCE